LSVRILVVNVFLYPLFSYLNRLFFMPSRALQDVERRVLAFLAPACWCKLGMFTALGDVYGLQVWLRDLRLTNVASILSTHEAWPELQHGTAHALSIWRRRHCFLASPALSWKAAFDFYLHSVGAAYPQTLQEAQARRGRPVRAYAVLSKRMAAAQLPTWRGYLSDRVHAKGFDGELLCRQLRYLPRSMPQSHR